MQCLPYVSSDVMKGLAGILILSVNLDKVTVSVNLDPLNTRYVPC